MTLLSEDINTKYETKKFGGKWEDNIKTARSEFLVPMMVIMLLNVKPRGLIEA